MNLNLDEYQIWTRTTAIYPERDAIDYLILGLTSEAGEVAGKRKKEIRDNHGQREAIISELGDVLWYVTRLADELGLSMSQLALDNKNKLEDRKSRNVLSGSGDKR